MTVRILQGAAQEVLATLPAQSVHCVVTSPPYWGQRAYQTGSDREIGSESTPELWVANLVEVFRGVKRVLRDDGTLWLNIGDKYAGSGGGAGGDYNEGGLKASANGTGPTASRVLDMNTKQATNAANDGLQRPFPGAGYKPKDLIGLPWMLAFALRADGWYLRSEIIWHKVSPMPSSVGDRPTTAHEIIFLFAKAQWLGRPRTEIEERISDQDARWLALLLDTEGNITAKRVDRSEGSRWYGLQIGVANTNRALLERALAIVGHGTILDRNQPAKGFKRNAPIYYLQWSNRQAHDLLLRLYPHFIVKARQARLGIYLQDLLATSQQERHTKEGRGRGRFRSDTYTTALERCWATMKILNHFGDPSLEWVPEPEYGRWGGNGKYYYDAEAVREKLERPEELTRATPAVFGGRNKHAGYGNRAMSGREYKARGWAGSRFDDGKTAESHPNIGKGERPEPPGRNARSVQAFAPSPFSIQRLGKYGPLPDVDHYALMPISMATWCIKAGTSERGVCAECGAPWVRQTEIRDPNGRLGKGYHDHKGDDEVGQRDIFAAEGRPTTHTLGWAASCEHTGEPIPATVLDPFMGAGTTALAAERLGRNSVGIELSADYIALAQARLRDAAPMLTPRPAGV